MTQKISNVFFFAVVSVLSREADESNPVGLRSFYITRAKITTELNQGIQVAPTRIDMTSICKSLSQMLHGTGIFTYIYHKSKPNVGK